MRCPTCGARQTWSDVCRRCRSDLTLLRDTAADYDAARRRCLAALRAGRPTDALRDARRCYALRPDTPSQRLLAVCHALCGNWSAALAVAFGDRNPS